MTRARVRQAQESCCQVCGCEMAASRTAAMRCAACFDAQLRGMEADFLENYRRLGARSRIVVAEACLRSLVLSDIADRKLLAKTIYEQFVGAASELVALYQALLDRREGPVIRGMLGFTLTDAAARSFFARLARDGPTEMLAALGLPHYEQVGALRADLDRRERKQVCAALHEAALDLERLAAFRSVGEDALVSAAARLGSPVALAEKADWLAAIELGPDQLATLTLNQGARRIEVDVLQTDEETLGSVVDGIETLTRLTRNIIFAFVSLDASAGSP